MFRFKVNVRNSGGTQEREVIITIKPAQSFTTDPNGIPPDIIAMFTLRSGYVGVWYNVSIYAEGTRVIS